eukprot:TRINITY_DN1381_c0_g1_i2.p2 TRINITY_DN1381_c0_g1~~TRINITY_DN1381_c0_g1_i2.p2  ORF type:complete len:119 (-),score=9.68 TRINITY_DN1381_c0_g1_i2:48-404(-)
MIKQNTESMFCLISRSTSKVRTNNDPSISAQNTNSSQMKIPQFLHKIIKKFHHKKNRHEKPKNNQKKKTGLTKFSKYLSVNTKYLRLPSETLLVKLVFFPPFFLNQSSLITLESDIYC